MGLFDRIFRSSQPVQPVEEYAYGSGLSLPLGSYYSNYKTSKSMMLSTVYRCVTCIANAVSSLPVKLYTTDENGYKVLVHNTLSYCLAKQPNKKMSSFTFFNLIIKDILLQGNAYALIKRDSQGNIIGLDYIPSGLVSPIDKGDHIEYMVVGSKIAVRQEDILHFINYSEDGVIGISTLSHARRTLGITDYSETSAENFFKSGGSATGFLKFNGPSNDKQKQEIQDAWTKSTGSNGNLSGIPVLPVNVDFHQISINPADAQLLESRKFNIEDICRFFSISPVKAFSMDKASYNTVEATELSFLNDTLRPILVKLEMEMERKFFPMNETMDVKFDTTELLRADKKSQAEYFQKLFTVGAITSNEIRKAIDLAPVEGGDDALIQVNMARLKDISNINYKDIDNRLKDTENNTEE